MSQRNRNEQNSILYLVYIPNLHVISLMQRDIRKSLPLLNIQESYFENGGHIGFIRIARKLDLLSK